MYSFGIEFAKILEGTIATGGADLFSDIVQVLDIHSKWMPADENSQRKIHYIAGFLIGAVTKNSKRNISVDAIKHFLSRASLVQDAAVENGLPVDDVVERQVDQLHFASGKFYDVAIKLECVFYHILGEKNIEIFGPQIIAEMESCLNKVDIGISSILDGWKWKDEDDVNIPEGTFMECEQLTDVEVHERLRRIDKDAFLECTSLTGFNFKPLSTIGPLAFANCTSLGDIQFGDRLESIERGAFANCTSIRRIKIPTVTTIECSVFSRCRNLTDVEIGKGLTAIGDNAFDGCTALIRIKLASAQRIGHWRSVHSVTLSNKAPIVSSLPPRG